MGNLPARCNNNQFYGLDDNLDEIIDLTQENFILRKRIEDLESQLIDVEKSSWDTAIDKYVDEWFENNRDVVDIGSVKIMNRLKVDFIPDELEKHMYKKVIKILYSILQRPDKFSKNITN